ncbi:MAG: glycosyltransferase [Candidatus Methylomirabilales bacterium]
MRVTMHTTTAANCGIADYARDLLVGLRGTVDVEVVPISPGQVNPFRMLTVGRRLNAADLTHIHHNFGFWGRGSLSYRVMFQTLQRAITVPVVLTPHSVFPVRPRRWNGSLKGLVITLLGLHDFMDRKAYLFADRIIVHSRCHFRLLAERGIPVERLTEIMPGVPEVSLPPVAEVETFRRRSKLEGKRVLGLFGFIQPNKNYELAVQALAHLPSDVVLLLVGGVRTAGEAWYGARIEALASSLGVASRVRITGFLPREELGPALSAADLYLLPYVAESSVSYSARVCLAYEKPLLASAVEAFQELRERYRCVELFISADPAVLAGHILELLNDPARRAALVKEARTLIRERSWRHVAAETLAVYRSVLGG